MEIMGGKLNEEVSGKMLLDLYCRNISNIWGTRENVGNPIVVVFI